MKRYVLFFVVISLAFLFSFSAEKPKEIVIRKVVIDAGHGGHDPGAVGKYAKEKDVALAIALKLGNYIKTNFPKVEVIYTRKTDVFVELYNRAKIANDHHANLFISIHCNSSKTTTASGTETWVMGLNKSQANLDVAKKENSSILLENDYSNQYDGFDPNSSEANIIFSLFQNAYLDQSLEFAAAIQKQFTERAGRSSRGVKQAGFLVLYKTTMPGVLVETGFISNAEEEAFLNSDNGQSVIASAIYRAFKHYKEMVEGATEPDVVNPDDQPVQMQDTPPKDTIAATQPNQKVNDTVAKEICFRVQFATSSKQKPLNSPDFKGLSDIRMYVQQGIYKYTSGNFKSLAEAVKQQDEVQKAGFKDAFVVAFLNEQRISPTEAVKLLQTQK